MATGGHEYPVRDNTQCPPGTAGSTAAVGRETNTAPLNPAKSTADEAVIPAPLKPTPRAYARAERAQNHPSRVSSAPIGTAGANGAGSAGEVRAAVPVDTETEFQFVRELFPNRDDEAGSRLAYFAVLRASADVHQTVGLLRYGARRYAAFVAERLASGFQPKIKTLAQFVESGLWRGNNAKDAATRAAAGHAGLDQHKPTLRKVGG